AWHPFHGQERVTFCGCTGVEDLRDARVIQPGQGLALEFEASDEARLEAVPAHQLERHDAADGPQMLGTIHGAETTFTEHFEQAVAVDLRWLSPDLMLGLTGRSEIRHLRLRQMNGPPHESDAFGAPFGLQQALDFTAQRLV